MARPAAHPRRALLNIDSQWQGTYINQEHMHPPAVEPSSSSKQAGISEADTPFTHTQPPRRHRERPLQEALQTHKIRDPRDLLVRGGGPRARIHRLAALRLGRGNARRRRVGCLGQAGRAHVRARGAGGSVCAEPGGEQGGLEDDQECGEERAAESRSQGQGLGRDPEVEVGIRAGEGEAV